jgi:GT2 family glycosyltransferase
MMISDEVLRRVGFLEEGFGMYFEEPDLGVRARRSGFRLAHAASSIVIHKEGGSVSPERASKGSSERQVEWLTRSRLLFTWKHYPWLIPMAIAASIKGASTQAFIGKRQLALAVLRGLRQFLGSLAGRKSMFTEGRGIR